MEITDEYVISILWPNKICLLDRCKDRLTDEVKKYLENKFTKSESLYETLYCIKHNIDRDKVKCQVCGVGDVHFVGSNKRGIFTHGCCTACQMIYRNSHSIETSLKKYGVTHPRKNKEKNIEINALRKSNNLKKYGVEEYVQTDEYKRKLKETSLKLYGTEHPFQSSIIKDKIHKTCIEKYGTNWTFQDELSKQHYRDTLYRKYGVYNSFSIPSVLDSFKERKLEIQKKRDNTKRQNKTFGTSIPENKTYRMLCNLFGESDVIREYYDERYPFKCDFYVKSKDMFIECNYFWTHMGHFFDKSNEQDIEILHGLMIKAETKQFYNGAITTWTERDVLKYNTAKENKLNYVVFWSILDAEQFISNYERYREEISSNG